MAFIIYLFIHCLELIYALFKLHLESIYKGRSNRSDHPYRGIELLTNMTDQKKYGSTPRIEPSHQCITKFMAFCPSCTADVVAILS